MGAKVYTADCREVIRHITEPVDLIFADPPFNIGQMYAGYNDSISDVAYREMIVNSIYAMVDLLREGGVLCLHGPDALVFTYLDTCGAQKDLTRIGWVNWCYSFAQYTADGFSENRTHCLIFRKGRIPHTFNGEAVSIPSVRMLIGDSRAAGKRVPGAIWGLKEDEAGVPLEPTQNEKGWGRVVGNHPERVPVRPNQLPLAYLKRLIAAYTNPGEMVFDPYCGTGTTAVAALLLGRNCITCDIDKAATEAALKRIYAQVHGTNVNFT